MVILFEKLFRYCKQAKILLVVLMIISFAFSLPVSALANTYGSGTYGGNLYSADSPDNSSPVSSAVNNITNTFTSAAQAWICTKEEPRSAPDLYEIDAKDTQATLYFAPAKKPYTDYYVSFGDGSVDEGYGASFSLSQSTGALKYDVYHLKPNMNYTFKVRAGNDCKPGPWSSTMTIKTLSKKSKTLAKFYPKKQAVNTYKSPTLASVISKNVLGAMQKFTPSVNNFVENTMANFTPQPTKATSSPAKAKQEKSKITATNTTASKKTCVLWLICW